MINKITGKSSIGVVSLFKIMATKQPVLLQRRYINWVLFLFKRGKQDGTLLNSMRSETLEIVKRKHQDQRNIILKGTTKKWIQAQNVNLPINANVLKLSFFAEKANSETLENLFFLFEENKHLSTFCGLSYKPSNLTRVKISFLTICLICLITPPPPPPTPLPPPRIHRIEVWLHRILGF